MFYKSLLDTFTNNFELMRKLTNACFLFVTVISECVNSNHEHVDKSGKKNSLKVDVLKPVWTHKLTKMCVLLVRKRVVIMNFH